MSAFLRKWLATMVAIDRNKGRRATKGTPIANDAHSLGISLLHSPKSLPKKRYFDAHTISIWARNMVQRGGSAQDALRMLLGRMQNGRLPHTTPLYNTALDICGHQGMLFEAGRIFHQMVARNVRSNERTISSLLNAIAEHCSRLRVQDKGIKTGTRTRIESTVAPLTNPLSPLESGPPSLEAFQVEGPDEAAELAIRLYTSWMRYTNDRAPAPFNNLLKVMAVTGRRDLLVALFPPDREGAAWIPHHPDQITYTIAISAAGSDFGLARSYWDVFLEGGREEGTVDENKRVANIGFHLIKAITWSLLLHVTEKSSGSQMDKEIVFFGKILEIVTRLMSKEPSSKKEALPSKPGPKRILPVISSSSAPIADVSSNIMHLCVRLRMITQGLDFWHRILLPQLQQQGLFSRATGTFDQRTLVALCELYIFRGTPNEAIILVEQLEKQFGMRLANPDLLTALLLAHRRLGDTEGAIRLFDRHCRRISLDHRMVQQLFLAIQQDSRISKVEKRTRITAWLEWLREADSKVYNQTTSIPKLRPILKSPE